MVGMRRSRSQSPAGVSKFSQSVFFSIFVFQYFLFFLFLYFYICAFCIFVFNQGDQGRQIRIRISKSKLKSDSLSDFEFCSESASWSRVNGSHESNFFYASYQTIQQQPKIIMTDCWFAFAIAEQNHFEELRVAEEWCGCYGIWWWKWHDRATIADQC